MGDIMRLDIPMHLVRKGLLLEMGVKLEYNLVYKPNFLIE